MATTNRGDSMSNQETPARGQRGILISGFGGGVYFRQYAEDHSFVDYEVTNYDVEIEILDPHAALIRNSRGDFLDYTAESMNVVSNSDPDSKTD
jgi:hypothetical protein